MALLALAPGVVPADGAVAPFGDSDTDFPRPIAFGEIPPGAVGGAAPGTLVVALPLPGAPHPPIELRGAGPALVGAGIRGGTGTAADPYVVSGWQIDLLPYTAKTPAGTLVPFRDGIAVRDTLAHVLVTGNTVRGAPSAGIRVENAPNVRVEHNAVVLDNAALASEFAATGARPTGVVAFRGASSISWNAIAIRDAGLPAAVGIRVTDASPSIVGNTVSSEGRNLAAYEGILLEQAPSSVSANVVRHDGSATLFAGIRAYASRAVLRGNDVANGGTSGKAIALEAVGSSFATIESNTLSSGSIGLLVTGGAANLVRANVVRGNLFGFLLQDERSTVVVGNRMESNVYGFGWHGTADEHFRNTIDATNSVDGRPVVVFADLSDEVVDGARLGPVGFLAVVRGTRVEVQNVAVQGSVQGLLLADFNGGLATNLTLAGNFRGVEIAASFDSRITRARGPNAVVLSSTWTRVDNSTFDGGGFASALDAGGRETTLGTYALGVRAASQFTFVHDVTLSNAGIGLLSQQSSRLSLSGSLVRANTIGLWFDRATSDVVRGTAIEANYRGVDTNAPVDARSNWWGSPAGPFGGGNSVPGVDGGLVQFTPWLALPPAGAGA